MPSQGSSSTAADVIVPSAIFAHISSILAFRTRDKNLVLAVICGPVLGLAICVALTANAYRRLRWGLPSRGPSTVALASIAALILAVCAGDANYHWYMRSYYNYNGLAAYTNDGRHGYDGHGHGRHDGRHDAHGYASGDAALNAQGEEQPADLESAPSISGCKSKGKKYPNPKESGSKSKPRKGKRVKT